MRAIIHRIYGQPDVMQVKEVEKPVPEAENWTEHVSEIATIKVIDDLVH